MAAAPNLDKTRIIGITAYGVGLVMILFIVYSALREIH